MVRKKIDNRLRILIENGVAEKHRSMFVVVGDHGRDQVRLTSGEFVSIWLNKVGQIRYDKSDWNLYINSRERMKQGQDCDYDKQKIKHYTESNRWVSNEWGTKDKIVTTANRTQNTIQKVIDEWVMNEERRTILWLRQTEDKALHRK